MRKNKSESKSYKIISVILNLLLIVSAFILVLISYNFMQTKVLKKDYSNIFGYTAFKVVSGSMADTINIDDIVIVKLKNQNL